MYRLICCLLLPMLALAMPAWAQSVPGSRSSVLVLGRISDDPRRDAERLQPMLDYVVPRLRDVGIREGRVLMARDAGQMHSYLRRNRVHWISDSAVMAIDYQRRTGATLLLATEREGRLSYSSVFFTWRGSGIDSLDDLRGHSIGFQNAYSTSSYVLPAAELLRAGLDLDVLLSPLDRAAPNRVGYLFARNEGNVLAWVQKRLVDAGAFSDLDWQQAITTRAGLTEDLVIFHETADAPRAIEVTAPSLDPVVRERLREVLLAAGEDPAARDALARFFNTHRFVPLDAGVKSGLERLRGDLELVRTHLE